jgi:hypothetical protein
MQEHDCDAKKDIEDASIAGAMMAMGQGQFQQQWINRDGAGRDGEGAMAMGQEQWQW